MAVIKQVRVVVTGLVQGVFFRASTEEEAKAHGLRGYVRNNSDGTVEAVFIGRRANIDKLIEWCRLGPKGARVDNVDITEEELTEDHLTTFTVDYGR